MLNRQYGIANPTSIAVVAHPEDSQPNEGFNGRNTDSLPRVLNSAHTSRGGLSGRESNPSQSRPQHAIRGSWRGRGNHSGYHAGRMDQPSTYKDHVGHRHSASQSSSTSSISHQDRAPDSQFYSHSREGTQHYVGNRPSSSQSSASPTAATMGEYIHDLAPSQDRPFAYSPPRAPRAMRVPTWVTRSRSPTPKLPPQPLKRRKLTHDSPPPSTSMPPPSSTSKATLPRRKIDELPVPQPTGECKPLPAVAIEPTAVIFVKDESPPPAPIVPQRRLVTEACSRFPLPDNCKKSHWNHQENRRDFARQKNQELIMMGLKRTKAILREDGLVIEWTSKTPVWNDTLLPDAPTLAEAMLRSQRMNNISPSPKRKRTSDRSATTSPKRKRPTGNAKSEVIDVDALPSGRKGQKSVSKQGPASSLSRERKGHEPQPVQPKNREEQKEEERSSLKRDRCVHTPTTSQKPTYIPAAPDGSLRTTSAPLPTRRLPPLPTRRHLERSSAPLAPSASFPSSTTNPVPVPVPNSTAKPTATEKAMVGLESKRPSSLPPQKAKLYGTKHADRPGSHPLPGPSWSEVSRLISQLPMRPTRKDAASKSKEAARPRPRSNSPVNLEVRDVFMRPTSEGDVKVLLGIHGSDRMVKEEEEVGNFLTVKKEEEQDDLELEYVDPPPLTQDFEMASGSGEDEDLVDSPDYDLAIEFINRFTRQFDSDRMKLEMAYAKDALFSCRVHHLNDPALSTAGLFAPEPKAPLVSSHSDSRASASTVEQGRSQIVHRLLELGTYEFCPRGVMRPIYYDLAALSRKVIGGNDDDMTTNTDTGGGAIGGMLATLHAEVVNPDLENPELDHILTLDQSFVLRRRMEGDDDHDTAMERDGDETATLGDSASIPGRAWPLVAVSHQMTVRDGPLLPVESLQKVLPWIEDMPCP